MHEQGLKVLSLRLRIVRKYSSMLIQPLEVVDQAGDDGLVDRSRDPKDELLVK